MNKRIKKKKIGYWAFIKYPSDEAIYSVCQSCGFTIGCSKLDTSKGWKVIINKPYTFCPNCGRKMKLFDGYNVYDENGVLKNVY